MFLSNPPTELYCYFQQLQKYSDKLPKWVPIKQHFFKVFVPTKGSYLDFLQKGWFGVGVWGFLFLC